jgi:hypothetical protein
MMEQSENLNFELWCPSEDRSGLFRLQSSVCQARVPEDLLQSHIATFTGVKKSAATSDSAAISPFLWDLRRHCCHQVQMQRQGTCTRDATRFSRRNNHSNLRISLAPSPVPSSASLHGPPSQRRP